MKSLVPDCLGNFRPGAAAGLYVHDPRMAVTQVADSRHAELSPRAPAGRRRGQAGIPGGAAKGRHRCSPGSVAQAQPDLERVATETAELGPKQDRDLFASRRAGVCFHINVDSRSGMLRSTNGAGLNVAAG